MRLICDGMGPDPVILHDRFGRMNFASWIKVLLPSGHFGGMVMHGSEVSPSQHREVIV